MMSRRDQGESKPNGENFWRGVICIALNDEPGITDADAMTGYASVHAIAEAFNCSTAYVAKRVVDYRKEKLARPD